MSSAVVLLVGQALAAPHPTSSRSAAQGCRQLPHGSSPAPLVGVRAFLSPRQCSRYGSCLKYSGRFLFLSVGSNGQSQGWGFSSQKDWSGIAALLLTRALAADKSPFPHRRGAPSSAVALAVLTCSR